MNYPYRPSLEIAAELDEYKQALAEYEENPPVGFLPDDRYGIYMHFERLKELIVDMGAELYIARSAEYEARKRGCTPAEVVAIWNDYITENEDYDAHDSDAPPDMQSILDEQGMREASIELIALTPLNYEDCEP